MYRLREKEARIWVLLIAANQPSGVVSTAYIKEHLPRFRPMSPDDLRPSRTRPGEPVWAQIVGNVICHKKSSTSIFVRGFAERTDDGIQILDAGRTYLERQKVIPYRDRFGNNLHRGNSD